MTNPKVSIIVPVYNTEKYLEHCIGTLTSQTLREVEIIMVDDGSKEECAILCDELAKKDERVRVIHKVNEGAGLARNAGIKEARGEYIGFVDSDDFVDLKMYEVLYESAIENNADIVVSGTGLVGGNTFGNLGGYEEKNYFDKITVFENDDIKKLILGVVGALPWEAEDSRYGVGVWKNIFRRSLISEGRIEFLSERKIMSEDTVFLIDFIKRAKKAVGIPGAFYRYRRNEVSLSKSYKSDRLDDVMKFLTELEKHINDIAKKEEYQIYLDRLTQGYGRILCSQEIMYARDNKINYIRLRKRLKMICTNERIAGTLKNYPWYKLPKKQALFAFAMKYKLYFMQKLMVTLRAR